MTMLLDFGDLNSLRITLPWDGFGQESHAGPKFIEKLDLLIVATFN
jgi:hypothetical protein